ncbi:MAG: hypothetical protein ACJ8ED_05350, partial [Xanthobacteraceae bacterium]
SPAGFDPHISAVRPTKLLKRLHERGYAPLRFRILGGEIHQHTDTPHAIGRLRARSYGPCGCGRGDSPDEIASFHSLSEGHDQPSDQLRLSEQEIPASEMGQ